MSNLEALLSPLLPPAIGIRTIKPDPVGLRMINNVIGEYPNIKPGSAKDLGLNNMTPEIENALRLWLVTHGLYQLPTIELVEWLRERIGGRDALEICAGHGWLGEALSVRSIDGWVFQHPALQLRAALVGKQQNCKPMPRVEPLMAGEAIYKYKPKVVFGCFVTHKWDDATETGSAFGVDDRLVLECPWVETYILIGCDSIHGPRPLLREDKHEKIRAPWLFGRGEGPAIWVWESKSFR